MAQTTDGMSFADAEVAYQIEGDASPTDMSGFAASVEISGFETQIGEAYTVEGDIAILTAGKIAPGDVTVKAIYTENDADPTKKLFDAKAAKKKVKFIWYPRGNAATHYKWETDFGFLTTVNAGGGEASSPDALLAEFALKTAQISHTTVSA